jgi:hypothetical protein
VGPRQTTVAVHSLYHGTLTGGYMKRKKISHYGMLTEINMRYVHLARSLAVMLA